MALKQLSKIRPLFQRSLPVLHNCLQTQQQKRFINLQEYQSKELMRNNGVKVQRFCVIESVDEIKSVIGDQNDKYIECPSADSVPKTTSEQLNSNSLSNVREYVIKAQVLAGGRGKGYFRGSNMKGGVQLTKDKNKIIDICAKMLNDYLITAQTTANGVLVKKVMIAEALDIKKELYLAIVLDRASNGPVIVSSQKGGMDIEEVAHNNPQDIHKFPVSIDDNSEALDMKIAKEVSAKGLGLSGSLQEEAAHEIASLYKMFLKLDALQVEINPFGITTEDSVVCFDAKINFDDNALFRHKWMKQIEKENASEEDPRDILAKEFNLNFVPMEGNIACLVNGAGLAMATMDIIHYYGGSPANFLDVGGSVNQEGVENAFRLITADNNVRAILVNIFGGIVNCETIARGLISARNLVKVPLIVRLEGTNAEVARNLLSSVPDIISAADLDDAAHKAVNSVSI